MDIFDSLSKILLLIRTFCFRALSIIYWKYYTLKINGVPTAFIDTFLGRWCCSVISMCKHKCWVSCLFLQKFRFNNTHFDLNCSLLDWQLELADIALLFVSLPSFPLRHRKLDHCWGVFPPFSNVIDCLNEKWGIHLDNTLDTIMVGLARMWHHLFKLTEWENRVRYISLRWGWLLLGLGNSYCGLSLLNWNFWLLFWSHYLFWFFLFNDRFYYF